MSKAKAILGSLVITGTLATSAYLLTSHATNTIPEKEDTISTLQTKVEKKTEIKTELKDDTEKLTKEAETLKEEEAELNNKLSDREGTLQ